MVKIETPSPWRKMEAKLSWRWRLTEVDKLDWKEAETNAKCKKKLVVKFSGLHREMEKQP